MKKRNNLDHFQKFWIPSKEPEKALREQKMSVISEWARNEKEWNKNHRTGGRAKLTGAWWLEARFKGEPWFTQPWKIDCNQRKLESWELKYKNQRFCGYKGKVFIHIISTIDKLIFLWELQLKQRQNLTPHFLLFSLYDYTMKSRSNSYIHARNS